MNSRLNVLLATKHTDVSSSSSHSHRLVAEPVLLTCNVSLTVLGSLLQRLFLRFEEVNFLHNNQPRGFGFLQPVSQVDDSLSLTKVRPVHARKTTVPYLPLWLLLSSALERSNRWCENPPLCQMKSVKVTTW